MIATEANAHFAGCVMVISPATGAMARFSARGRNAPAGDESASRNGWMVRRLHREQRGDLRACLGSEPTHTRLKRAQCGQRRCHYTGSGGGAATMMGLASNVSPRRSRALAAGCSHVTYCVTSGLVPSPIQRGRSGAGDLPGGERRARRQRFLRGVGLESVDGGFGGNGVELDGDGRVAVAAQDAVRLDQFGHLDGAASQVEGILVLGLDCAGPAGMRKIE
jgi:hypothetical protein